MIVGGRYTYDEIMYKCIVISTIGDLINGLMIGKRFNCYYTFNIYHCTPHNNSFNTQLYTLIKKSQRYES